MMTMIGTKIQYEIDNYSELFSIEDYLVIYNKNRTVKIKRGGSFKYKQIIKNPVPKECGVYVFYNSKKEVVYIGSSTDLRFRIESHLFADTSKINNLNIVNRNLAKRKEVKYFAFILSNISIYKFIEIALIDKYKPVFNIIYNPDNEDCNTSTARLRNNFTVSN